MINASDEGSWTDLLLSGIHDDILALFDGNKGLGSLQGTVFLYGGTQP